MSLFTKYSIHQQSSSFSRQQRDGYSCLFLRNSNVAAVHDTARLHERIAYLSFYRLMLACEMFGATPSEETSYTSILRCLKLGSKFKELSLPNKTFIPHPSYISFLFVSQRVLSYTKDFSEWKWSLYVVHNSGLIQLRIKKSFASTPRVKWSTLITLGEKPRDNTHLTVCKHAVTQKLISTPHDSKYNRQPRHNIRHVLHI